jgi:hypothetical protein
MEAPNGVKQAVMAIWATIAISAVGSAIAIRLGYTSQGDFAIDLIVYALICILPYKLANGSYAARYVYFVLNAVSVIFLIAGGHSLSKPDIISTVIQVPLTVFAIYQLVQPQANAWFTTRRNAQGAR